MYHRELVTALPSENVWEDGVANSIKQNSMMRQNSIGKA